MNTNKDVVNVSNPETPPRRRSCMGCLVIPGLFALPVAGIVSGIFPLVGIVLLVVLAGGLLMTFHTWRKDPKVVLNLVVAGFMLFSTIGCSAVTNIKFGGWWTDPTIPTARGVVSRQEWFTKDYMEGYKDWQQKKIFFSKYELHGLHWFYLLVWVPIGSIGSAIEVGSALVLPKKILHVEDPFAPSVPNHITWADDPFKIWLTQVKSHYYNTLFMEFDDPFFSIAGCPHGNCLKEWSYFIGIEDFYLTKHPEDKPVDKSQ